MSALQGKASVHGRQGALYALCLVAHLRRKRATRRSMRCSKRPPRQCLLRATRPMRMTWRARQRPQCWSPPAPRPKTPSASPSASSAGRRRRRWLRRQRSMAPMAPMAPMATATRITAPGAGPRRGTGHLSAIRGKASPLCHFAGAARLPVSCGKYE